MSIPRSTDGISAINKNPMYGKWELKFSIKVELVDPMFEHKGLVVDISLV